MRTDFNNFILLILSAQFLIPLYKLNFTLTAKLTLPTGKSQMLECRVFNAMGAECLQTNIQNGGSIDVSALSSGVYSVLINFGLDESKTVQFVKQ